jgi:hypothetical protein
MIIRSLIFNLKFKIKDLTPKMCVLAYRCLGFARGPEQNDLHQSGCDSLPPNHEVYLRVDSRLLSSRPCS